MVGHCITENSNKSNKDILHLTSIDTSNKQVKKRKHRFKSIQISNSPNSGASTKVHIISGGDIPNILTEKVENGDLYILIERNRKETEEAEHESERILNFN